MKRRSHSKRFRQKYICLPDFRHIQCHILLVYTVNSDWKYEIMLLVWCRMSESSGSSQQVPGTSKSAEKQQQLSEFQKHVCAELARIRQRFQLKQSDEVKVGVVVMRFLTVLWTLRMSETNLGLRQVDCSRCADQRRRTICHQMLIMTVLFSAKMPCFTFDFV